MVTGHQGHLWRLQIWERRHSFWFLRRPGPRPTSSWVGASGEVSGKLGALLGGAGWGHLSPHRLPKLTLQLSGPLGALSLSL